jgi:hypothetical protein
MWQLVIAVGAVLYSAVGQQLEFFTARQGATAALQKARQDGFADAQLQWVLFTGTVPAGVPLAPTFDLRTGRATMWVYAVRSSVRDTTLAYAVVKLPLVGFQAYGFAGLPAPPNLLQQPLPSWWMDSDSLVLLLNSSPTYAEFRQRYPDSLPDFVTLGMAPLPAAPTVTVPLWTVVFLGSPDDPTTSMTCTAWKTPETQGTDCMQAVSVGAEPVAEVRLFPQPAREWVELEMPAHLCGGAIRASLEDMLGRTFARWEWYGCRYRLRLPSGAGIYRLYLQAAGQRLSFPVVVVP